MENDFVARPQGAGLDRESHATTSRVEGQTTSRSPWVGDPCLERSALWRGRPKRVVSSPCGEGGEEQAQAPLAGVPAGRVRVSTMARPVPSTSGPASPWGTSATPTPRAALPPSRRWVLSKSQILRRSRGSRRSVTFAIICVSSPRNMNTRRVHRLRAGSARAVEISRPSSSRVGRTITRRAPTLGHTDPPPRPCSAATTPPERGSSRIVFSRRPRSPPSACPVSTRLDASPDTVALAPAPRSSARARSGSGTAHVGRSRRHGTASSTHVDPRDMSTGRVGETVLLTTSAVRG